MVVEWVQVDLKAVFFSNRGKMLFQDVETEPFHLKKLAFCLPEVWLVQLLTELKN